MAIIDEPDTLNRRRRDPLYDPKQPFTDLAGNATAPFQRTARLQTELDAASTAGRDRMAPTQTASAFPEVQSLLGELNAAELNPTPSRVKAATQNLASFPYESIYFPELDDVPDRAFSKTLSQINKVQDLARAGRVTVREAADQIEPLRKQLEARAERQKAKRNAQQSVVYQAAVEENAQVAAERSAVKLEKTQEQLNNLQMEMTKNAAKPGEAANTGFLDTMQQQVDQLKNLLAAHSIEAHAAGIARDTAAKKRLESMAPQMATDEQMDTLERSEDVTGRLMQSTAEGQAAANDPYSVYNRMNPEQKRVFEDEIRRRAREAPGAGEFVGPISDEDRAILEPAARTAAPRSRTAEENRMQDAFNRRALGELGKELGTVPDEAAKRRNRKDYNARIKAAKTTAEKLELRKELNAINAGRTTPTLDARQAVAEYVDPMTKYPQSKELLDIDAKHNTKLRAQIAKIQAAMPDATGNRAKVLKQQFDKLTGQLDKNLKSQSRVIENENITAAGKADAALKLATDREARLVKSGTDAEKAAAAKEVTRLKERKEDADAKVEAAKVAAESKEKIAGVAAADKQAAASLKTHEQRRTHEADVLKIEYTDAKAKHKKAHDALKDFQRKKERAGSDKTTFRATAETGEEGKGKEKSFDYVVDGEFMPEGRTEWERLKTASADAWAKVETAKAAWTKKSVPPIKPETKGEKITKEIRDAYLDFYGSGDAALQAARRAGWSF